jgi:hypothetical protein
MALERVGGIQTSVQVRNRANFQPNACVNDLRCGRRARRKSNYHGHTSEKFPSKIAGLLPTIAVLANLSEATLLPLCLFARRCVCVRYRCSSCEDSGCLWWRMPALCIVLARVLVCDREGIAILQP